MAPSSIFLSSNTAFLHHHISFSDTPVSLFHFKNHQSLLCWTHPDNKDNLSGFLFFKSTTQFLKIHLFVCIGSYLPHVGSFVAEHRLLSSCGAWAPECLGPVFAACGLSCPHGMWDIGSQTRDGTHVPCIGKQILNHRTTREVPYIRDLCHISPYEVSRPRVLSPVYWKRDAHMIT